jgi:hypothetical protein
MRGEGQRQWRGGRESASDMLLHSFSRRTRSRFMLSIALSIPLTTLPIELVTIRMATAVSTRLATASIRDASRRRLRPSVFLRIAF